jgi:hypothetical protein
MPDYGPPDAVLQNNLQWANRGPWTTQLSPQQEQNFRQWLTSNQGKMPPFDPDAPQADYDMRGFYKGMMAGDPAAQGAVSPFDGRIHFSDKWKTPYHHSFSNESIYAKPNAPRWIDNRLTDQNGNVLVDESTPTKSGALRPMANGNTLEIPQQFTPGSTDGSTLTIPGIGSLQDYLNQTGSGCDTTTGLCGSGTTTTSNTSNSGQNNTNYNVFGNFGSNTGTSTGQQQQPTNTNTTNVTNTPGAPPPANAGFGFSGQQAPEGFAPWFNQLLGLLSGQSPQAIQTLLQQMQSQGQGQQSPGATAQSYPFKAYGS